MEKNEASVVLLKESFYIVFEIKYSWHTKRIIDRKNQGFFCRFLIGYNKPNFEYWWSVKRFEQIHYWTEKLWASCYVNFCTWNFRTKNLCSKIGTSNPIKYLQKNYMCYIELFSYDLFSGSQLFFFILVNKFEVRKGWYI
jgi:hypothetical protein